MTPTTDTSLETKLRKLQHEFTVAEHYCDTWAGDYNRQRANGDELGATLAFNMIELYQALMGSLSRRIRAVNDAMKYRP